MSTDQPQRLASFEELLRRFASGVRAAQLYAPEHPLVARSVEGLLGALKPLHQQVPTVPVGIVGQELVVADTPLPKVSAGLKELISKLQAHQIERISFERGITAEEVVGFMMILSGTRGGPAPKTATVQPGAAQPGNASGDDAVQSVEAEFRLAEQHYQNAIAKLEEAAKSDQSTIDPQTAAMLQKNLQVIDQAIAESRAALKTEPQSAPARDSLFEALKRKVTLLQDTIALMNEMRKGNAAGAAQLVDGLNKS